MKRIVLAWLLIVAGGAVAYVKYPAEFVHYMGMAKSGAEWAWSNVQSNLLPVCLAAGTFLLTVVYHKAKGKSLRESVEVAATRVTVVPVAFADAATEEHPVVRRAKARAMRAQLLTDQIGIQNRQRKLPEEVMKAEKDACYTEQAVADAKRRLAQTQNAHTEAMTKLEAIRNEKTQSAAELAEIEVELRKLTELV
jgi:hypothetical protein